jgi:hypothetical protein
LLRFARNDGGKSRSNFYLNQRPSWPGMNVTLLPDIRLHQAREIPPPAKITSLRRNGVGNAFLHDHHLRTDQNLLQRHRRQHLAREIGILECVAVAHALVGNELDIFPAPRSGLPPW